MGYFWSCFWISSSIVMALLVILRLSLPYSLLRSRPIPYQYSKESADWLNFLINRAFSHFESEEVIETISQTVNKSLGGWSFYIKSMGIPPQIEPVTTFQMESDKDLQILIPLDWTSGPSVELGSKNSRIEFEFSHFGATLLLIWPKETPQSLELRFFGDVELDFWLNIRIGAGICLPISTVPIVGAIAKQSISNIISRIVVSIGVDAKASKAS